MLTTSTGEVFRGVLEKGQVWLKGKTERTIVKFNATFMWYEEKGEIKKVTRSVFRRWLTSGDSVLKLPQTNG